MSSSKSLINDLTEGSVPKKLIIFALPFALSNLLQTLYNLVDMVVMGNFVGSAGISAVSIGSDIIHMLTFIGMGFASAGQVMIAQYVGVKDKKSIAKTIGTLFSFITLLSIVMTVAGCIGTDYFLNWLNTPAEAFRDAHNYTLMCFIGTFFIYGYNTVSAILRGMGDSKHPLIFVAIAAGINLVLDLVFIAGMGMGAIGAALGTVIGQGTSFVISIAYLYRRKEDFGFDFKPKSFAIEGRTLITLVKLGLPMALQYSAISISCMFVNSYINSYGVTASAVTGIGTKLSQIVMIVTNSLSTAGSSMIGQNISAGKTDRIKKVMHVMLTANVIFASILAILMVAFPEQIFSIFNSDPEVLTLSHQYIPIAVLNFMSSALRSPFIALINGIGFASMSLAMGILDGVVFRIGLAILLGIVCDLGIWGFWLGSAIAGFAYCLLGCPYYLSGKWKTRKTLAES